MSQPKETVYAFLKKQNYMTLATADASGKPEAATVRHIVDGDSVLVNIFDHYRKYQNLLDNPRVACVMTVNHDTTLQFDGTAEILSGAAAEQAMATMLAEEPDFMNYFDKEHTKFLKITPTWMRLRDYTTDPETVVVYEPGGKNGSA